MVVEWLRTLATLPVGPRFGFQNPQGSSQPSETTVPGDLITSSGFHGYQGCTWYTDVHAGQIPIHIKNMINK